MPFKKGQSGNPGGRSTDRIWRAAVMRAVHRRESKKDPQALDKLADKLVALGLEGDVAAMREIGDRLDGKPTQAIEHGGNVATRTVIRADVPAQSIEEWQQKYAQPEQPPLH